MSPLVVDASAAVRAVMDAAAQPALLTALEQAGRVLAPGLMVAETGNALWKYQKAGVLTADEAQARHHEACALVDRFVDERELFPEALALAMRHAHPVYDAVYVVLARRQAARLASFDARLRTLCESAGADVLPLA